MREDLREPILEALIEEAVGFVNHLSVQMSTIRLKEGTNEEAEVLQTKVWCLGEMIHQSTWRGDEDVEPARTTEQRGHEIRDQLSLFVREAMLTRNTPDLSAELDPLCLMMLASQ